MKNNEVKLIKISSLDDIQNFLDSTNIDLDFNAMQKDMIEFINNAPNVDEKTALEFGKKFALNMMIFLHYFDIIAKNAKEKDDKINLYIFYKLGVLKGITKKDLKEREIAFNNFKKRIPKEEKLCHKMKH